MMNQDETERKEEVILSLTDAEDILQGIYNYFGSEKWSEFVLWYYDNEL